MRFEECSIVLDVRPNDLDSLGHVNNATILEYLEAGRWAWIEQHGFRRTGSVLPIVARIEVDYRREILLQQVNVHTRVNLEGGLDNMRYQVEVWQKIFVNLGEHLAVNARVQVGFIGAQQRSLCTLKEFLAAAVSPALTQKNV